jgi:hypothetical protein
MPSLLPSQFGIDRSIYPAHRATWLSPQFFHRPDLAGRFELTTRS